jgi:hypothetical protein
MGKDQFVVPLGYSSSRRIADILLKRVLARMVYRMVPASSERPFFARLLPSDCKLISLTRHFPDLNFASPVVLELDDLSASRFMGTFQYQNWINHQIARLVRHGHLPRQSRHILLRPLLKSFRPEYPVHENLEQVYVFHDLDYPSGWAGSFCDYVNKLCFRLGDQAFAHARTGDLPSSFIFSLCLELFREQQNVIYSFEARTFHYWLQLKPQLWLAPISFLQALEDPSVRPILVEWHRLVLEEYVYPSLYQEPSVNGLADPDCLAEDRDEEDDDNDPDGLYDQLALPDSWERTSVSGSGALATFPGTVTSPSRHLMFARALKLCREFHPEQITDEGLRAVFNKVLFDSETPTRGHRGPASSLYVFLPKPPGESRIALLCNAWMSEPSEHQVAFTIRPADLRTLSYSNPLFMGWGQLFLCSISPDVDPESVYRWAMCDSPLIPVDLLAPLIRIARIDDFRFRR